MDCSTCKEKNKQEPVPFNIHERDMARMDRNGKRWFIAWVITFVLFLISWGGFLWYESQWEVVESTEVMQEVDGAGSNGFVGGNYYGAADSQNYTPEG